MDKAMIMRRVVDSLEQAARDVDFAVGWFEATTAYSPAQAGQMREKTRAWKEAARSAREVLGL